MVGSVLLAGLGAGLSLIIAIGAQNAFVLRQGLRGEHVGPVVAVCIGSDLLLISLGTGALAYITALAQWVTPVLTWGGFAFLVIYGVLALRRAVTNKAALDAADAPTVSRGRVVMTAVALTWLNPHVYLDTVLLLGSLANSHQPWQWWFAVGAMVASCLWFVLLGFGARWLRPVFASPVAWRVLDGLVALLMWAVAISLVW